MSTLCINSFFIELSFTFFNDRFFVSACKADVPICVINYVIYIFVFFAKTSMQFFPDLTCFVLLAFPFYFEKQRRACLERHYKNCWRFCILPCNSMNFLSEVLSRTKVPGVCSTKKNILLFILRLKSEKLEKTFFHLKDCVLGMNFIPRESTRIVAKFGLNFFEKLWIPIGITWFSKMFIGATSGEYGSTLPPDLKAGLLELVGPLWWKKLFCWRKLDCFFCCGWLYFFGLGLAGDDVGNSVFFEEVVDNVSFLFPCCANCFCEWSFLGVVFELPTFKIFDQRNLLFEVFIWQTGKKCFCIRR